MPLTSCKPEWIDDFLTERLDDAQQQVFEAHLDECDACCAELQRRTADVSLWNDARTFLSSTDRMPIDSTKTVVDDGSKPTASTDMLRLDFLGPTDDPHMLGRFAGYEISVVIGCGGMGIVLKGFDLALNRYSAIKVLAPHYASSGAARQRFAREAQAAAAVVHDNVIGIHGVDEFNGLPYLVMPYVKGESLQKRIDQDGALSVAEILRVGMQTARGLSAAHDQGLVHRDIKPANILLPEKVERVIITDFGLARAADDASLTRSGVIAGTPQYMSPEQARGEGVDCRSDLFSLGSVMYTMCTGHAPFRAETPYGILRRITDHDVRPVREVNTDVPAWLSGIVEKLMQKDSGRRFQSAEQVASLLEECLAHVQQPNRVPLPETVARSPHRNVKRTVIGGALTVIVLGAAALLMSPPNEQSSHDNRSSETENSESTTEDFLSAITMQIETSESANESNVGTTPSDSDPELQWELSSDIDQLEDSLQELNDELSVELSADLTEENGSESNEP